MSTYTVHTPPRANSVSASERFVFVRDGFYFWAFLFAPFWLIAHGLWLALVIYIAVSAAIATGLIVIGASAGAQFFVWLLLALLVGFEASTLRRWGLARRGWSMIGFVVGDSREDAEHRYFAKWVARGASPSVPPPAQQNMPARRASSLDPDVIGLFPEPDLK